jgi:transposase
MTVTLHDPADLPTLERLARAEADARQRDRYRAVLLAAGRADDGREHEGDEIARRLDRSPRFVDRWVAAYRRGGVAALRGRPPGGRRPARLAPGRHAAFKARLLAGPTAADGGVCTLRGPDAVRILREEFGVELKLAAVYKLMRRLNLSCLRPRPRHPKGDPAARQAWVEGAPLLPTTPPAPTRASASSGGSRTRPASGSRGR